VGQSDVVVYDTESEANDGDDDDDDDDDGREMSAAEMEDVLLRMMNKDEAEDKTREMRWVCDAEPGDANCTIVEAVLVRRSSATEGKPAKPAASGIRFREISPRCPSLPFSCTLSCNTTPPLPDFKEWGTQEAVAIFLHALVQSALLSPCFREWDTQEIETVPAQDYTLLHTIFRPPCQGGRLRAVFLYTPSTLKPPTVLPRSRRSRHCGQGGANGP